MITIATILQIVVAMEIVCLDGVEVVDLHSV